MIESPFQNFIDLIKFDQESHQLLNKKNALNSEIVELNNKKEQLDNALDDTKKMVHSLKKEVDSNELLIQELDQEESKEKKRLDSVSNQREYKSVQAELASINRKQQEVEIQLIELWNKYEALKKQYKAQQDQHEERTNEIENIIPEKNRAISAVGDSIKSREKQRIEIESRVPKEWLEKYSSMRAQVKNPVVAVESGSCSACFYPVSRQDLMLLKSHQLVQCRSCYRLLYLKGIEEREQGSEENKDLKDEAA